MNYSMRTLDESTENLASNYLKPTPVKQAFIFYYLWLLWAAYENILHSVCHLWSNAVVVLNTSLLWWCKCLNWFVSRKWPAQLIRSFLRGLILLDNSVLLPFACLCRPWAIHYVCLPGLYAIQDWIENAF